MYLGKKVPAAAWKLEEWFSDLKKPAKKIQHICN
jgi:hypothetical protein